MSLAIILYKVEELNSYLYSSLHGLKYKAPNIPWELVTVPHSIRSVFLLLFKTVSPQPSAVVASDRNAVVAFIMVAGTYIVQEPE